MDEHTQEKDIDYIQTITSKTQFIPMTEEIVQSEFGTVRNYDSDNSALSRSDFFNRTTLGQFGMRAKSAWGTEMSERRHNVYLNNP
jgi:hypothetical protein